jgi:hypothetical protein
MLREAPGFTGDEAKLNEGFSIELTGRTDAAID